MAKVPYNGIPDKAASFQATPSMRIDTPGAAFGTNIGQAISHLGQVEEHVGNELWHRAVALQELRNESEVNLKTSEYIMESGKLDNSFRLLSGNQPQGALEGYVTSQTDLRESFRDSLSSDAAKKRFDNETMRRHSYNVVNAGSFAATQFRQYAKGSEKSLQDSAIESIMRDPENDGLWNELEAKLQASAGAEANLEGGGDVDASLKLKGLLGKAVAARAGALAKHNPEKAQEFFDKVKDKLRENDRLLIQETINDRGVKAHSAQFSTQALGGDGSLIERAKRVTKIQESGGKYGNVTTTTNARTGKQQHALGAYGIMSTNVGPWSKEILGKEVSQEEFLASREIQDAIYEGKMGQYIKKYGVEGAGQAWLGGEGGVGQTDRKDAFGTTVGNYGQRFAQLVGPEGQVSETQRQINTNKLIEERVQKLYPIEKDPELHQRAMDQFKRDASTRASVQQREYNQQVKALSNDIGVTLNTQNDKQRKPTSIQEANQIDPSFQEKYEQLSKLDPGAKRKYENWFVANGKEDVPYSNERQQEYNRWVGMKDEERAQYDANDAFNKGLLTSEGRNKILGGQAKEKHNSGESIKVDSILRRHGDVMNAIKAYPSRTNKAANDRYTQFRGALILDLRAAQEAGKPVKTPEEEDQMLRRLISQQETGDTRMRRFPFESLGVPIPFTSTPITSPRYQQRSLDYPIDVGSDLEAARKLKPGQIYILNGQKSRVPK